MLIAIGLSVLTAALFGINIYFQRAALADTDPHTGALLSVAGMAGFFWLLAPWLLQPEWFTLPAFGVLLLLGLMWPAMGQSLQVLAVQRVGPALTASIGSLTPLFAVALAMVVLHEPITWYTALGIALMVAGLTLAAWAPHTGVRQFAIWALLLPVGAALARGLAQPIAKYGMQTIPSPYFVTLVAGSVSTVLLLALRQVGQRARRRGPRGTRLVLISGVVNGVGIFFLNTALTHGKVALVASIVATAPLWSLLFGAVWFKHEALTRRHLMVAVMVFMGSVLVVWR
ncbi:MAG: DMT family transporter [Burkholderiaceae bacterium]